ncbi:unnamed protein product [Effrenium voratum]|nr:unnamed protein product [Effrenium voratum]
MEPSSLRSFFEKRCQDVEDQVERRQAELVSEMSSLMQRNEAFQSVIQSQEPALALGTPPRAARPSRPFPPWGSATKAQKAERRQSIMADDRRNWAEQRQFLMEDLRKDSPCSPEGNSFDDVEWVQKSPGVVATPSDERLHIQREWWAQQRRDLLQELEKEARHV